MRVGLDASLTRLSGEVNALQEESTAHEREFHELQAKLHQAELRLATVKREEKLTRENASESLTHEYNQRIQVYFSSPICMAVIRAVLQ